ncbi:MAG TPA: hypothetical protein VHU89_09465 [Acidobacteriaceae bacterium]|jgi:hypothetical protein|nr:hypothetical protein [Acidobacteriaceae bacterium]
MKSRTLWIILDILAVVVVLGRIGSAMSGTHFWLDIVKLYPPLSGELVGADIESLTEYFLVIAVIVHNLRPRKALT